MSCVDSAIIKSFSEHVVESQKNAIPTTDVMERWEQTVTVTDLNDSNYMVTLEGPSAHFTAVGNAVRVYDTEEQKFKDLIVMTGFTDIPIPTLDAEGRFNTGLLDPNNFNYYESAETFHSGSKISFTIPKRYEVSEERGCGMHRIVEMSYKTLVFIVRNLKRKAT